MSQEDNLQTNQNEFQYRPYFFGNKNIGFDQRKMVNDMLSKTLKMVGERQKEGR